MEEDELRSDALRDVGDVAREMGKLVDQPAWGMLRDELANRRTQEFTRILRRMMHGGIDASLPSQRELDYKRGFFSGAQWILDNPDLAERSLKEALRRITP